MLTALYEGRASLEADGRRLAGDELAAAVGGVARLVAGLRRVAVVAHPGIGSLVATAGVLAAGGTVIPLDPSAGRLLREHVLRDAEADLVLDDLDPGIRDALPPESPADERPALILYASGTTGATGPPRRVVIPRRALTANLDAPALPLTHAQGFVLVGLSRLRTGGEWPDSAEREIP
jgi:acyl-CoA synthetase (AMP-forming)/AMP-acid ligase II